MRITKRGILAMFMAGGTMLYAQGKIRLKKPGAGGGEKIALTKPGGETPAAAPEAEYSTSKGPEAKPRTIYLGPFIGFNVSGIANGMQNSQNANGWEVSPVVGLRSELYFRRVYGIITDIGYEQNRAYLVETPTGGYAGQGILRTDYVMVRSMFSYRFSLYKVFGKVKFLRPIADALKPFAGNLQAGIFAKTPLSAQLEILGGTVGDPNDPFYDTKSFAKVVSGGFMAGMGFELRLGSTIFFFEGQYFRGILPAYDPITSRYFVTDKFSEQGIYFSSGIKTGIYGF
ncbi:MAG: hypothetical protein U1F16_15975 [Turneriella sp.]